VTDLSPQAQPEQQAPSDKELLELMPESMRDEFSYAARVCSDAMGRRVKPGIFRVALNTAALEYARAVLDRWGGSAPCPYVVSSDEGTSYCRLAEHTADQLAKLLGEGGG
jgi:hypothetical protein